MATKGQPKKRDTAGEASSRNWLTILYPESLRDDFRDIIGDWHVPAVLSPLHDKDVWTKGEHKGEPKKPHYHLMVMFTGKKGYHQMEELFGGLLKAGHAEPVVCQDMRSSARYWCHMDDPQKAQYDPAGVTCFAGVDYQEITELPTDKERYIREMCAWCRAEGCISFAALVDEAATSHPDWHHALVSNCTMVMFRYVRSLQDEMQRGQFYKQKPTPEAEPVGEVDPVAVAKAEVANAETALLAARERLKHLQGDRDN